jgi:hypothetical protein
LEKIGKQSRRFKTCILRHHYYKDQVDLGRACSTHAEKMNVYRVLVGMQKRTLEGPRRTLEDNIKMDFRETGWGGMDWNHLAQGRDQWKALVNTVMNLRVP